jgi:hypothetical protein
MRLKMTIDEVYQFFGSLGKASKITGIQKNTIWNWTQRGYVPFKQQKKIEEITKRKLIANKKDARKPECDEGDENNKKPVIYLPKFRYHDDKYGMCEVESLHFRKDRCPKITYKVKGKSREKFSSFVTEKLMQASNLTDSDGEILFEGDICKFKSGKKLVFSFDTKEKFENITFKIIGNAFEK